MAGLTESDIRKQSESAYKQWCEQWREHAKIHSQYAMHPLGDYENVGIGKTCVLVANGASLERDIEDLKKHQDNVDILCCDKTLGTLLANGITPTYCLVADANVDYDEYLKPWTEMVSQTTLFMSVCANPLWTEDVKWKQKYFFVNRDILKSEEEFSKLSGCMNFIPAGTNVSNAMLVFLSQSDNAGRRNFFGYDKYLLTGYDYSWSPTGNYYAFSDGAGKGNYMRHAYGQTTNGELCYTSNNLVFSAKWFEHYVKTFTLPVIQCSDTSIVGCKNRGALKDHLSYNYKREDKKIVYDLVKRRKEMLLELQVSENKLKKIGNDHHMSYLASV